MKREISPAVIAISVVGLVLVLFGTYWFFGGGRTAASLPGAGQPARQPPPPTGPPARMR